MAENSLAGKVSDAMHAAFWQKLRADLEAQPPEYNMLTALLDDVKEVRLLEIFQMFKNFIFFRLYYRYSYHNTQSYALKLTRILIWH